MAARANSALESQPLLDPSIQQQPRCWGRAIGWGVVTIIFGGVAGAGAYAISQSPGGNTLQRTGDIGLDISTGLAALYALGKTIYSLRSKIVTIVPHHASDLTTRTQQEVLDRLTEIARKYGQRAEEAQDQPRALLDQISKMVTLLDNLLETTVADRDHFRSGLEALSLELTTSKEKFQQFAVKSSAQPMTAATPSTPYVQNGAGMETVVDYDELQRQLLEEFEGFQTRVKVHVQTPPSGKSTPGIRTPIALTPSKLTTAPAARGFRGAAEGKKVLFDVAKSGSPNF